MHNEIVHMIYTDFLAIQRSGDDNLSCFLIDRELLLPVTSFYIIRYVSVFFAIQVICEYLIR